MCPCLVGGEQDAECECMRVYVCMLNIVWVRERERERERERGGAEGECTFVRLYFMTFNVCGVLK